MNGTMFNHQVSNTSLREVVQRPILPEARREKMNGTMLNHQVSNTSLREVNI